jgi:hypothetical protein
MRWMLLGRILSRRPSAARSKCRKFEFSVAVRYADSHKQMVSQSAFLPIIMNQPRGLLRSICQAHAPGPTNSDQPSLGPARAKTIQFKLMEGKMILQ